MKFLGRCKTSWRQSASFRSRLLSPISSWEQAFLFHCLTLKGFCEALLSRCLSCLQWRQLRLWDKQGHLSPAWIARQHWTFSPVQISLPDASTQSPFLEPITRLLIWSSGTVEQFIAEDCFNNVSNNNKQLDSGTVSVVLVACCGCQKLTHSIETENVRVSLSEWAETRKPMINHDVCLATKQATS